MPKKAGSSLLPLFEGSRDAVCGIRDGHIVFANSAAASFFSSPLTGESAERYFPELPEAEEGARIVSELSRNGREYPMSAVFFSAQWVVTISLAEGLAGAISPSVLQRMRTAAFRMRLSIDRLLVHGAEQSPYAEILLHNYYSILHLSNELSDFSAVRQGSLPLRTRALDFNRLCCELTDSARTLLGRKALKIEYISEDEPCVVSGDRERLEQLLLILLSNSALHTPSDGCIRLTLRASCGTCRLTVEDTGDGIPPEMLESLFSPTASPNAGAPGLGLLIASGIVRSHGGSLMVHSDPGSGTRIGLSLPMAQGGALLLRDSPEPVGASLLLTELSEILPTDAYSQYFSD